MLYVEDEPHDFFFMQLAWEQSAVPNPLVTVQDGQQAMDYLAGKGEFADRAKHPFPCLLLLDLKLPIRSGFDVLKWIREHSKVASLKVVIISGSFLEADIAQARTLGVADYVIKPSSPSELTVIVKQKWKG
ncbi:MAG: two-component system response regulator, partial [Verrucomicrobia bacterium]